MRTVKEILEEINFRRAAYKKQFEELLGELTEVHRLDPTVPLIDEEGE